MKQFLQKIYKKSDNLKKNISTFNLDSISVHRQRDPMGRAAVKEIDDEHVKNKRQIIPCEKERNG